MTVRRADYMEAMVDLAYERGYDAVNVADIAAQAGGKEADFVTFFPSKQDCAVAALEEIAESNVRVVRCAFDGEPTWPDSLRAAAYAHARWITNHPKEFRFGLLEALWVGELTGAMRDNLFKEFIAMVDAGRGVAEDPDSIPAFTAEGVVGSITQTIARSLGKPERDLFSLVPEMMFLAVRPYLGEEAARKELTVAQPEDRIS